MDNKYKKINLNLDIKDAQPHKPDVKWLWITVWTIVWFFAFAYICFSLFANLIVANIDIEQEKKIFWDFFKQEVWVKDFDYKFSKQIPEFKNYNISVSDSEEINAYAIVWANIVVTQALIDSVKYEEELQMILAHEISHVKTRDSFKSLVRDLPLKMTLFFIGFDINLGFTNLTDLALNKFSRDTEMQADNWAIKLLKKHNINPYCASRFFDELPESPVWFMSTHPVNNERIENMKNNFIWEKSFDNCVEIKR